MIQYSYKTDEYQREYAVGRQFIQDIDDILTMNLVLKTKICFSLHSLYGFFLLLSISFSRSFNRWLDYHVCDFATKKGLVGINVEALWLHQYLSA